MVEREISTPQQQRSIDKKNRILKAGYELICKNGYYNTNTAEIAKAAGVSTGILYRYFKDKKDIFLQGLEDCFSSFSTSALEKLELLDKSDMRSLVNFFVEYTLEYHNMDRKAYKELVAISNADIEIQNLLVFASCKTMDFFVKILPEFGINQDKLKERVKISYHLIENYVHEYTFYPDDEIDYTFIKEKIIDTVMFILTE